MEYLPLMIIMSVLQLILYNHLKVPISLVELSIKGIHFMQMLFFNVWSSFQFCGPQLMILNQLFLLFFFSFFLLHPGKSPIDPSFFLKSLKDDFIEVGCSSFGLHAQRDVAKLLEILLEELTGPSIVTSAAYNIKSLSSITCHTYTSSSCS